MAQLQNEFYDEEVAGSILRRASEAAIQQGISREELLRSAAELGITQEQLALAEQEILFSKAREEELEKFRQERRINSLKGFFTFLCIAGFAAWFDFTDGQLGWIMIPFLFWGWSAISELYTAFNSKAAKREFDDANRVKRFMHPSLAVHDTIKDVIIELETTDVIFDRKAVVTLLAKETGMSLEDAKDAVKAHKKLHPNANVG